MKKFNYKYVYFSFLTIGLLLWVFFKLNYIPPYYLQIFMLMCINVILTTSLNLINGFCGQLSIGHAGFMAIGAYTSCIFTTILFEVNTPILKIFIFVLALIIGGIVAGGIGYLIGLPLLKLRGDYLAIGTLAFNQVLHSSIKLSDEIGKFIQSLGLEPLAGIILAFGGPRGLGGIPKLTNLFYVITTTILVIFVINRLIHSSYGRAWTSIRDDETASEMMGVDTTKYKLIAFSLAGLLAGVAGGLYAHLLIFIHPDNFSLIKSIECLIFLYLGGMGSIFGSIISASLLTFLLEFLRIIQLQQYRLVFYPLILIILMLKRPEGLFRRDI
jgi:branched-chain amino acid transport system permease protein